MNENNKCFQRKDCRICRSENLEKVIELTPTPPGNNFLDHKSLKKKEELFPLNLNFCKDCFHIQLGHVVDPEFLFQNNYSYVSATSKVFVKHLNDYSEYVSEFLTLSRKSFVLDIGSNDGTCLKGFKKKGMSVLGVDPAKNIAETATKNGIETIPDFFSSKVAQSILKLKGKVDLITSHNACAHIDDLDEIMEGVSILLKDNGTFVMEVGYFLDVFKKRWFDTIYHEHLDFHTVLPLDKLFTRFGMEIFRVERISPQGGSIRVFVQKINGPKEIDETVSNLIDLEKNNGLNDLNSLKNFEDEINLIRVKFKKILDEIKDEGSKIAAFGAPTKATTLCYHFDIDNSQIDFIVDDNPLKQGLFSPGKHIPVYSSSAIYEQKPEFIIILAWNFAASIIEKHKEFIDSGGSFIVPMPIPEVIKKNSNTNSV